MTPSEPERSDVDRPGRWPGVIERLTGDAGRAFAAYLAITVVMTWPLVTRMSSDLAWDMGDPAFNCYVLLWTGGQVLSTLSGDFNAIHRYWDGNIFSPEPLTIAYSEHLTAQMLQGLPILAATGNVLLVYNLLFISTFALSGLGMYLLVRDLTGRPAAAWLAGLAFAFAPYRLSQFPHLQVLSSQWMPLVLYGFRRYFVTGRLRPLAGGSAALVVQNLSCGYYMLFFGPFVLAYGVYEMAQRRLLLSLRTWRSLIVAGLAIAVLTWPFVSPYFALRMRGDVGVRSYDEALQFSADVYSFGSAAPSSALWGGRINAFQKGEGEGFPGFTILALALVGIGVAVVAAARAMRASDDKAWQRIAGIVLWLALAVAVGGLVALLFHGSLPILVEGRPLRDTTPFFIGVIVITGLLIAVVPSVRRFLAGTPGSLTAFYAVATIAAALLSLGPRIQSAGRLLGFGPFYLLWAYLPGFNGIRVPARYFMIVALFLAVLAGLGAAAMLGRRRAAGLAVVGLASAGILAECWVAPIPLSAPLAAPGFAPPAHKLQLAETMSPLYRTIRDMPGKVVLIEFPFGEPAYEIQATYYAGLHRRPLVNGFSGFFPEPYLRRGTFLAGIPFDLDAATRAVQSSNATHAIVHEGAYLDGRGREVTDWLTSAGASIVATYGSDKLLLVRSLHQPRISR